MKAGKARDEGAGAGANEDGISYRDLTDMLFEADAALRDGLAVKPGAAVEAEARYGEQFMAELRLMPADRLFFQALILWANGKGDLVGALKCAFAASQLDATHGTVFSALALKHVDSEELQTLLTVLMASVGKEFGDEALQQILPEVNTLLGLDADWSRTDFNPSFGGGVIDFRHSHFRALDTEARLREGGAAILSPGSASADEVKGEPNTAEQISDTITRLRPSELPVGIIVESIDENGGGLVIEVQAVWLMFTSGNVPVAEVSFLKNKRGDMHKGGRMKEAVNSMLNSVKAVKKAFTTIAELEKLGAQLTANSAMLSHSFHIFVRSGWRNG